MTGIFRAALAVLLAGLGRLPTPVGVLAVVVASPCTAPFTAGALASRLPRPGAWTETFRKWWHDSQRCNEVRLADRFAAAEQVSNA